MVNFHAKNPLADEPKGASPVGSSSASPMGPSAANTGRFEAEFKRATADSKSEGGGNVTNPDNAAGIVAEELQRLELEKKIEIDQSILNRSCMHKQS